MQQMHFLNGFYLPFTPTMVGYPTAVSSAIINLESALKVTLFDRSGWKPQLTAHGEALLVDARAVIERVEKFKARAMGLACGLEAELSIVIDVMFPTAHLVELVTEFRSTFPGVELRICIDVLGGIPERVLSGEYSLGIQGSLPDVAPDFTSYQLPEIAIVPVAAPIHPLALQRQISKEELREHTQVVLTDHSGQTKGRTFSVFSSNRILTADLGSKHAMIRAGLGWGFMPRSFIEDDLNSGRLTELDMTVRKPRNRSMPLFLIHHRAKALGFAGQWVVNQLSRNVKTLEANNRQKKSPL